MMVVGLVAACSSSSTSGAKSQDKPKESCQLAGDEDGNGLADCADPACAGIPACRPVCGNGKIETGEACDDGNAADGDGCDRSCEVEVLAYLHAAHADAEDVFGWSVALSADGSTLAIGAFGEASAAKGIDGDQTDNSAPFAGAVYVFTRSGAAWRQAAYVKASNPGAGYLFGVSVALSADGTTLAVGSPGEGATEGTGDEEPGGPPPASGAVYVFTRRGTAWSQEAYVKASNPGAGDLFGDSVALSADGSTLAVGSDFEDSAAGGVNHEQDDESAQDAGAVYVFTRSGAAWRQEAYVKASNPGAGDQFGGTVSLSGDGATLAVGALFEDSADRGVNREQDDESAEDAGAVYVFIRRDAMWRQEAYVKASNTDPGDQFGKTVRLSTDGATLAVGAPDEASAATGIAGTQDDNAAPGAGAVYVFTRSDAVWRQEAYVKASNTDPGDGFGLGIALSADGSALAVGAAGEASAAKGLGGKQTDNTAPGAGAVYGFARDGKTWSQQIYVKASNTAADALFGWSVALSADGATLAVGAIGEGGSGGPASGPLFAGAVYVYP